MSDYLKKELLHIAFAIGITVLVAVGAELAQAEDFSETFWTGVAITAVRSIGTALVVVLSRYVVR